LAFTILLGLLFSPHLNPQDGFLLIAPLMLFYIYLRERQLPCRAYACFVLSCPALFLLAEFTIDGRLGIRVPVVVMVMLMPWMGRALYDDRGALTAEGT